MTVEVSTEALRLQHVAKLLELGADLWRSKATVQGLEELLGAALGAHVVYLESKAITPPRTNLHAYVRAERTHSKTRLKVTGNIAPDYAHMVQQGIIAVFTKSGQKSIHAEIEKTVSAACSSYFRPPHFFGSYDASGVQVGVWEFLQGERIRFQEFSLATQQDLVRAIADLNVVQTDCVPRKTKWVDVPLSWYKQRLRTFKSEQLPAWLSAFDRLTNILTNRDIVRDVIRIGSERFLCHQDLNANNVFVSPDGRIAIFDWEGATLSVPGADLRFLVYMETRDILAECYAERMADLGVKLEISDVRRAYEVIEAFRLIYKGWAGQNVSAVTRGLGVAESYISMTPQAAPPEVPATKMGSDI